MKKALQIISIQHELSMAIGNSLDLLEMMTSFMRVSMARLDLSSIHFFLYKEDISDLIFTHNTPHEKKLSHFNSIPVKFLGKKWCENESLKTMVMDYAQKNEPFSCTESEGKYYQFFTVQDHGVMVFESVFQIEELVLKSLQPIFNKLALSCYACVAHQALVKEMAARRSAEDIIAHQASYDELTQLCNRRKLTEHLQSSLLRCQRNQSFGALIFMDLNHFKSINDVMGHDLGDSILKEVAIRLKNITRGRDTVARFGGDEFLVLFPDLGTDLDEAEKIVQLTAERIHDIVEQPFNINEMTYNLSCSIGYEIYPAEMSSANDVIKNADLAMYEAKLLRNRSALRYTTSMSEKHNLRTACVVDLKNALLNNEFMLHYQPQYNSDYEIIGAEALLRWNHPKYIHESPATYIAVAEDSDLIIAVGDWVLNEACQHLKILKDAGVPDTFKKISINVSAKQLVHAGILEKIQHNIIAAGIDPNYLSIEITENVLISRIQETMVLINQLKSLGVDCAIDDFGTGYSSLAYLKRLPSSLIKIDRNFVHDIHTETENRSIATMIIALGKNLEMDILAEGVETEAEFQCLKALGCYKYQGYYFSRPLAFEAFKELLHNNAVKIKKSKIKKI